MSEEIVKENEELQEFAEFKRKRREEEARQFVSKVECDLSSPTLDKNVIKSVCETANTLGIGAVCVLPCMVKACVNFLGADPKTAIVTLISYPHGADTTKVKTQAVKRAIKDGTDEVEITAPIPHIINGNWNYVKREFKKIKSAARGRAVRINVESPLLNARLLVKTCTLAADAGINCITLASATYGNPADEQTLTTVKSAVKDKCLIKVNGTETYIQALRLSDMGATLLGAQNAIDLSRTIIASANDM